MGIALDHIDKAAQPQRPRKDLLDLKVGHRYSSCYAIVESRLRINVPADTLAPSDHVHLMAASSPVNYAADVVT